MAAAGSASLDAAASRHRLQILDPPVWRGATMPAWLVAVLAGQRSLGLAAHAQRTDAGRRIATPGSSGYRVPLQ